MSPGSSKSTSATTRLTDRQCGPRDKCLIRRSRRGHTISFEKDSLGRSNRFIVYIVIQQWPHCISDGEGISVPDRRYRDIAVTPVANRDRSDRRSLFHPYPLTHHLLSRGRRQPQGDIFNRNHWCWHCLPSYHLPRRERRGFPYEGNPLRQGSVLISRERHL